MPVLTRRKVLSTGASLMVAQVTAALGGIVTARALGPSGKGIVASVLAWPQVTAWVILFGLATATSLRVAESGESAADRALGNAVVYCLCVGLVAGLIALLVLPNALSRLGPDAHAAAVLAVLTIPLGMLGEVVSGIQLSLGKVRLYNLARIAGAATTLVATIGLVVADAATPETVVLGTIVGAVTGIVIASYGLPWRRMKFALTRLREDLKYGLRIFPTSLMGLINLRLDVLVMTAFLAANEIGLYTVAVSTMVPIAVVTSAAATLIMPAVGQARGEGAVNAPGGVSMIRRTALRYCALTLGIALALAAIVPVAVPLIFGESFRGAVVLAWLLLPGFVAQTFANVVDAGLVGMRKPWVGNASQGIGVVFTFALLPLLLPRYGAIGAAITSSVSYISSALVSLWALRRISRIASVAGGAVEGQPIGAPRVGTPPAPGQADTLL